VKRDVLRALWCYVEVHQQCIVKISKYLNYTNTHTTNGAVAYVGSWSRAVVVLPLCNHKPWSPTYEQWLARLSKASDWLNLVSSHAVSQPVDVHSPCSLSSSSKAYVHTCMSVHIATSRDTEKEETDFCFAEKGLSMLANWVIQFARWAFVAWDCPRDPIVFRVIKLGDLQEMQQDSHISVVFSNG